MLFPFQMLNSENLRKLESEEGAIAELTKEHSKLRAEYERKGARHVHCFPHIIRGTFKPRLNISRLKRARSELAWEDGKWKVPPELLDGVAAEEVGDPLSVPDVRARIDYLERRRRDMPGISKVLFLFFVIPGARPSAYTIPLILLEKVNFEFISLSQSSRMSRSRASTTVAAPWTERPRRSPPWTRGSGTTSSRAGRGRWSWSRGEQQANSQSLFDF